MSPRTRSSWSGRRSPVGTPRASSWRRTGSTSTASFAPGSAPARRRSRQPEETKTLTGMEIGGVTPFGLPPDLPIWVDAAVMARERIVLGGGSRRWKVIAPPAILLTLPQVEVVDGLAVDPRSASDGASGIAAGPSAALAERGDPRGGRSQALILVVRFRPGPAYVPPSVSPPWRDRAASHGAASRFRRSDVSRSAAWTAITAPSITSSAASPPARSWRREVVGLLDHRPEQRDAIQQRSHHVGEVIALVLREGDVGTAQLVAQLRGPGGGKARQVRHGQRVQRGRQPVARVVVGMVRRRSSWIERTRSRITPPRALGGARAAGRRRRRSGRRPSRGPRRRARRVGRASPPSPRPTPAPRPARLRTAFTASASARADVIVVSGSRPAWMSAMTTRSARARTSANSSSIAAVRWKVSGS